MHKLDQNSPDGFALGVWTKPRTYNVTKATRLYLMTLVLRARADILIVGQGGKSWALTAVSWWMGRKACPSACSFQLSSTWPLSSARGKAWAEKEILFCAFSSTC